MPFHRSIASITALLALLNAPTALASKLSDAVTAGDDSSFSNALQASIDLADPLTLQGSWQLIDTDTGKYNTFAVGGSLHLPKHFDLDLMFDLSPRIHGVQSLGFSATPSLEIDEGDDFYTAFTVPLAAEAYDIRFADYGAACANSPRKALCERLLSGTGTRLNADSKLTQFSGGLVVEQGIYDLTLSLEFVGDHYTDRNTVTILGRQFRGTQVRFNAVGGLLPTFPVLWESKLLASYKLRFGEDGWFSLKPLISAQHLEYEANHGHGTVLVAKIIAGFAKTIEVTAGYQVLIDDELDNSVKPPTEQTVITHYGVVGLAWLFGGGTRHESDLSTAEDREPSLQTSVSGGS
jgi:hypothetical protein